MVQAANRDAYRDHLHALLPSGPAWPDETESTLDALLLAIAERFAEVDLSGANLLDEILPNSTFDLLPDWERVVGLPDVCSVLGATITVRRASLLEKLVTKPNLSASEFERIGRTFGVDIEVQELDQVRAEALSARLALLGTTLTVTGGRWRFVWWVGIPSAADVTRFTTLSTFDTPFLSIGRNTELECRLANAAPAHTRVEFDYFSERTFTLPAHTEPSSDQIQWNNTAAGLGDVTVFRATGTGETQIVRVQLNGEQTDANNRALFSVDDGNPPYSAFGTGPEMSDAFERAARALVFKVPGLNDLTLAGPNNPNVEAADSAEPYSWEPGANYTNGAVGYIAQNGNRAGLQRWVADFKAAYAADSSLRATLVVSNFGGDS